MKLQIVQNLEDGRVRLDYKSSPKKPANAPSYSIAEDKADEFVSKYNEQADNLHKITTACTIAGGVGGWLIALHKIAAKSQHSLVSAIFGIPLGIIAGSITSAIISYEKKNNLMDKYNVRTYLG